MKKNDFIFLKLIRVMKNNKLTEHKLDQYFFIYPGINVFFRKLANIQSAR